MSVLVYGVHAVHMALEKSHELDGIHYRKATHNSRVKTLVAEAKFKGVKVNALDDKAFFALCDKDARHQDIVALKKSADKSLDEAELISQLKTGFDTPPLFLILDCIQDPHNLGACLRSADAAGVNAVIVPKDQSASITPAVSKVASGAAETVPLVRVTNLARTLKQMKDAGVWLVGGAGEATDSLYQSDLTGPIAIVVGNEGSGMRRLTKEHCDFLVKIPMAGEVSSLNVSVATGIMLFEAVRQRTA
jgi:23S rRNA (guanosine2251-2'-O)-methyltransferase